MLLTLLVAVVYFINFFYRCMYIQEAEEDTTHILSFLHPFVMIWNKNLFAESDVEYNISSKRDTK